MCPNNRATLKSVILQRVWLAESKDEYGVCLKWT